MVKAQTVRTGMQSAPCTVLSSLCAGADTHNNSGGRNRGDEGDGDGDGDDDDTAELLRELEKIMRERAAEQARVGQAELEATEAEQEARISNSNPLQILIPHWAIRSAPLL
jgi:hypothetical protein